MDHLLELGRIFFWKSGEIIKPSTPSYVASFEVLIVFQKSFHGENLGADLGGGCRGCALPPPDDFRFSNTTGILQNNNNNNNKNYVVYWC